MADNSSEFRVNEDFFEATLIKAVKPEYRGVVWPVYKDYEIIEEEDEPFVVASFLETEPYKTKLVGYGEQRYLAEYRPMGKSLKDAMSFYDPLRTPELIVDLAERAEKDITPEDARDWALLYGLLGLPEEDTVTANDGFMDYKAIRLGRRQSVRSFVETALDVRACLRTYEAMINTEVERDELLSVAAQLPRKAFLPFGPRKQYIGRERSWLFCVLGKLVQMRLEKYCYPLFGARTHNGEATGKFALSWGFRGLVGAVWLHMAWLLEAENERVRRCKLRDCLRVIHFEPGVSHPNPDPFKRNVRGKYKTRRDREFCEGRGCKQKYHYRKKAGWAGYD